MSQRQDPARSSSTLQLGRAVFFLLAGCGAWAGLDLFVRHDLPGASWLQHQAFRALVVPMEWATEGSGERLIWVLALGAVVLASALLNRGSLWARPVVYGLALSLALLGLTAVSLATLMERSLALGVLVSVVLAARSLPARSEATAPSGSVTTLLILATLSTTAYYVYALFMTRGEGYPLLQSLGGALRDSGASWTGVWFGAVALLGLGAGLVRPLPLRIWLRSLVPGILIGSFSSVGAALVLVPSAVLLAAVLIPRLHALSGALAWPARMVFPCLVAGLLFGHTYSARVLACPPSDHPRLQRLATPGEVFRLALGKDGRLALALREDQRFGAIRTDVPEPSIAFAGSGALKPDWRSDGFQLAGTPEELVYAASIDSFFASVIPADPTDFESVATSSMSSWNAGSGSSRVDPERAANSSINNVLARLNGDSSWVEDAFGVPGLCWVNTLHWSDSEDLLYIGCEEQPGLHRYDPEGQGMIDGQSDARLGDVQDLAFGEGELDASTFSISLWRSRFLTELDRGSLEIKRQVAIGGTHYHLAYDPKTQLLFASSYYGGRVRVVDARSMETRASLPGDFGTREVVVHPAARLLLASSTYSGELRLWSLREQEPRLVEQLSLGGHIKDIRVDPRSPRAWTWSQCGLYSIDLSGL